MIKLFFNRFSKIVLIMEMAGVLLVSVASVSLFMSGAGGFLKALLVTVLVEYAFIRFCASFRWYEGVPRFWGIELQFKKALVPTSYIMAISGLVILALPNSVILGIAVFLLAVIAHVNIILLYFHFRDKDLTPVNFYSG